MSKIKTTSELREYLLSAITLVGNGTMDSDKARNIVKLAGQINENLYAEVKVAKTQIELGSEAAKFGTLDLTQ
jgi:hypothetical protein